MSVFRCCVLCCSYHFSAGFVTCHSCQLSLVPDVNILHALSSLTSEGDCLISEEVCCVRVDRTRVLRRPDTEAAGTHQ